MRRTVKIREYEMSSHPGFRIKCECCAETDMGANGVTFTAVVSNSAVNGEPVENNTHGEIAGNNCGY